MDKYRKISLWIDRIESFFSSSKVRSRAVLVLIGFQVFTFLSAFASNGGDTWCWEVGPGYEGARAAETAGGKDAEQKDVATDINNRFVAVLDSVVGATAGSDIGCEREEAAAKYGKSYGLLGMMDKLNGDALANPPSVNLVAYMAEEWVPGYDSADTSVYADGYDYLQELNIGDLAERTRFISYVFFVVVLIAAGFLIMFRQKIGGQMVITIFNTLPKVVIGLILVTFSFAIVGLALDFGVVLMTIAGAILGIGAGDGVAITNPFTLISLVFEGTDGLGFVSNEVGAAGIVAGIVGFFATGGVLTIVILILAIVVIGIVFYASIKVYITLLKAYLAIILDTILASIILTIAVLPGKGNLGWSWFYRILRNVGTFVGVYFIINLAMVIYQSDIVLAFPGGLTTGTFAVDSTFSVLNTILRFIIPIGLFFFASEVPSLLEDVFPADGGRGAGNAMGNVQKSISKIPVVGSFFG